MSDLVTVAAFTRGFYRLLGVKAGDAALTRRGEAADEIAFTFLTQGCREAQEWMLDNGYKGWLQRTAALTFSGTDDADGGRYVALPADFLRANGNEERSALVEADGARWGTQIEEEDGHRQGDFYYIKGDELWLTRKAQPPATLYLEYFYHHPQWTSGVTIDFPLRARQLVVAEAAYFAKDEAWVPGGRERMAQIVAARLSARQQARNVAHPTRQPRKLKRSTGKQKPFGNRW